MVHTDFSYSHSHRSLYCLNGEQEKASKKSRKLTEVKELISEEQELSTPLPQHSNLLRRKLPSGGKGFKWNISSSVRKLEKTLVASSCNYVMAKHYQLPKQGSSADGHDTQLSKWKQITSIYSEVMSLKKSSPLSSPVSERQQVSSRASISLFYSAYADQGHK